MKLTPIVVLLLAGAAGPLRAQALPADTPAPSDTSGRFSLGVTAGTLGIGPEVGFRPSPVFGLRANATFFGLNAHFSSDDIRYQGKVRLQSGGVMLDLFPFRGGFRLSAGLRTNGNHVKVVATPTGDVDIGDNSYSPQQVGTITGRAETKSIAPSLTLGWAGKPRRGFNFGFEAGGLFEGRIRIKRFETSTNLVSPDDLEAERLSLQHDVDKYKVYPIVQIKIGFRF